MTNERFYDIICKCGYEPFAYSGRGMFGKKCFAITISSVNELFNFGVKFGRNCDIDTYCLNLHTDSLGLDTVAYWPDMKWDGYDE